MPSYLHQIDKHVLFPIERRGNTLIVTPKGDPCSFANLNFNLEHAALLEYLKKGPYRNLLVDLSGSNYFGAKVLGAIAEWAKVVVEREGQLAVCGASGDMRKLLHLYGFESQWPLYPTRDGGIKAIVRESSLQSLRRQWKMAAFLVCFLAALGAGYYLQPYFTDRVKNERDYKTIMGIWEEMQVLKAANAPPVEWRKLRRRAKRELEPILDDLNDRAGTQSAQGRAAYCLFQASKNFILNRFLEDIDRLTLDVPTDVKHEFYWQTTAVFLAKAKRHIEGRDDSDLRFPQENYNPLDTPEDAPPGEEKPLDATVPLPAEKPPVTTEPTLPQEPPADSTQSLPVEDHQTP